MSFPNIVNDLISCFERLPGIGPKTAQRLTFSLLSFPDRELKEFGNLLADLKDKTSLCPICKNISDFGVESCKICADSSRNNRQILVVSSPLDVVALERTDYKGVYHVLHGLIDPLSHIGPDDIYLNGLIGRVRDLVRPSQGVSTEEGGSVEDGATVGGEVSFESGVLGGNETSVEVVLATNGGMEGESTAHFIHDLLREKFGLEQVVITRIGRGLPVGGDIEYADDNTLSRALDGRKEI